MSTETLIILAGVFAGFALFAAALLFADVASPDK